MNSFRLTERDQFAVEIYLPESSSIEQTNRVARRVEEMIRALSPYRDAEGKHHERLLNMRTIVGGGGSRWYLAWEPDSLKPNYAEILIHTTDGKFTHDFAEELRVAARQGNESLGLAPIAGARVVPMELALGPPPIRSYCGSLATAWRMPTSCDGLRIASRRSSTPSRIPGTSTIPGECPVSSCSSMSMQIGPAFPECGMRKWHQLWMRTTPGRC